MRFFVYISDAKVDLLLAEVPATDREQVAAELAMDPAWLEIGQLPSDAPDELRFARAEAVAHALASRGQCAPLGGASPYVADTLGLHWGRLRHTCGGELLRHETESPVWFADEHAALVMVGSASRLLAQPPAAVVNHPREPLAATPYAAMLASPSFDAVDRRCLEQAFEPALPPEPGSALELPPLGGEGASTRPEAWAGELAALPVQRLSFLAKRLVYFEADASRRLLAAPVFVAIAM